MWLGKVRTSTDILVLRVHVRRTQWKPRMAAPSEDLHLPIVFGRAFLLELERGDLAMARVFARAFLSHLPSPAATT